MPGHYALGQDPKSAWESLVRRYAHTDYTVLISSEEFSRMSGLTCMGAIKEVLSPFSQIRIIAILRPQWQFLQSIYLEVSKKRSPPQPPTLVKNAIDSGRHNGLMIDYNGLLDQLEEFFQPNDITLLSFEDLRSDSRGIPSAFLDHLGIQVPDSGLTPISKDECNVSSPPLPTWIANVLSEPKVADRKLIDLISNVLTTEYHDYTDTSIFSRSELAALQDHFIPLNHSLEIRRAKIQPLFTLEPLRSNSKTLYRNEVDIGFWARLAREIYRGTPRHSEVERNP